MSHRAPFAALGLTATAAVTACKAFVALREAAGGALGLRVWDPSSHPAVFVFRLALCNARTAALWVLIGVVAALSIGLAPGTRRGTQLAAAGLAAAAAMLAVVDVQIYHVFHRFLDAALIDIGRGGGHGYIEPYAPPVAWLAFVGLPLLVVGAAFGLVRAFREDLDGAARWVFHPVLGGALACVLWMAGGAAEKWCGQGRGDFAHDPLVVLARSYAVLARGGASGDVTPEEAARLAPEKVGPVPPGVVKNVVLVVWDGVPASALTVYGSAHRTTPVLASRTDALVFDRFYSNATQSAPSALALFGDRKSVV